MAQNVGDEVKEAIVGPFRKGIETASKWLGDPEKPANQKAQTMNWKPEANEEQKAEIAGRKKLTADGPTLGGKKKTAKKTRKATARKKE